MEETKTILKNLDVHSEFLSDHVSNYANINGNLPDDRERMMGQLDSVIKRLGSDPELSSRLADPDRCPRL